MKNFILHWYPSLSRSAEKMKMGRNGGLLLGPCHLNGVALVQLSQTEYKSYLVTSTMAALLEGCVETV